MFEGIGKDCCLALILSDNPVLSSRISRVSSFLFSRRFSNGISGFGMFNQCALVGTL
jgi:hypothetical protein